MTTRSCAAWSVVAAAAAVLVLATGQAPLVAALLALAAGAGIGWIWRERQADALRRALEAGREWPRLRGALDGLGRALAVREAGMAATEADLRRRHQDRERQLTETAAQQQEVQKAARAQAREVVQDTTNAVVAELAALVEQVERVRKAATTIDERVVVAEDVTRTIVEQAASADRLTQELSATLRRIREVAGLIAEVADQTNLLALNASIEAARAGDAGRGFKVVADEVKALAGTSGQSSADISATIDGLERGAEAVARALVAMTGDVSHINEATVDLRAVAVEQRQSVAELDQRADAVKTRLQSMLEVTAAIDARSAERLALDGAGRLHARGEWSAMRIVDLSESGLGCVVAPQVLAEKGDAVEVELPLEGGTVTVPAKVMRRQEAPGGYELGLRFETVDPELILRVEAELAAGR